MSDINVEIDETETITTDVEGDDISVTIPDAKGNHADTHAAGAKDELSHGQLGGIAPDQHHPSQAVDIGVFQPDSNWSMPYDYTVNTGFKPTYIEFHVEEHNTSLGEEKRYAGASYNNMEGWATPTEQIVTVNSPGSENSNDHWTYVGEGQAIHAIQTNSTGENYLGSVQASVKSFNADGFTLEFTEVTHTRHYVIYKAFR